jgi:splicing factor 3B subunit 4
MASSILPPSLTSLFERNQEAAIYVGNLDSRVTEDILWELFVQCGPVVNVQVPRDKLTGEHQGFGFVEFRDEEVADYSIKIMHMIKLYGKPIKVNKASQDKRTQEVGANIFIGNLSDEMDEKGLKDIFSQFGVVLSTKVMRDPEEGSSKRYGFVSFDNFESSDEAIKKMNGQFISGKAVNVSYAYKKDTKGERHGSLAERLLSANRPNTVFDNTDGDKALTSIPNLIGNIPQNLPQNMPGLPTNLGMPNLNAKPPVGLPPNLPQFNFGNISGIARPPMNPPKNK